MEDDICSLGLYSPGDADSERWNFYRSESACLAADGVEFDDYEEC
jgi:hypothetical protein